MSSNSLKEPNEHKDGPVRNATFFASEYLLGAFALAIGFSLSVTVDKEILSLPKESLLELAIFVVTAFVVIGLYWISSALSFLGETQRNVLKAELDEALRSAQEILTNGDRGRSADGRKDLDDRAG